MMMQRKIMLGILLLSLVFLTGCADVNRWVCINHEDLVFKQNTTSGEWIMPKGTIKIRFGIFNDSNPCQVWNKTTEVLTNGTN